MSYTPYLFDVDSLGKDPSDREPDFLISGRHINHLSSSLTGLQPVETVPGLKIWKEFLTPGEQAECVKQVDDAKDMWREDLRRRVQHYGWLYDYKAKAITSDMQVGPLPEWLQRLSQRLYNETGLFDKVPEQVIVNEYEPGQGIATHTDHPGFGPTVCTISLLDDWEMDFSENWKDKSPALLQRGSCVLMTGEARHVWQHGIAPRKSELAPWGKRDRKRRLSLTFRTVLHPERLAE